MLVGFVLPVTDQLFKARDLSGERKDGCESLVSV